MSETAASAADAVDAGADLELTILMPCLDEAETVAGCVRAGIAFLERASVAGEVLVADNGSADGSPELAARAGARVVHVAARGYGSALRGGIAAARGRYVIMGDADGSYDFAHLDAFVERLRAGDDLVVGDRFAGGIAPGAMPWLHRLLGNPVLSALGRLFFRSPVRDFHCGLRGFRRHAAEALALRCAGMEFASEMIVKATLGGQRISQVPTTLSPDGRSRPPHLRSWRDGWRHLRFLLLFSPRWLFLYPGALLIAVGVAAGALLLPGPRTVGGVTFDVHTLVYAAAVISLGVQSVVFAVFTKLYAVRTGLLPRDARATRIARAFRLELGIALGAALLVIGLVGSYFAVSGWRVASFGDLDPRAVLRLVVPSTLALTLGVQLVLSSFLLSVLGLESDSSPVDD